MSRAAEAATDFTNHVFRNKLSGSDVIDNLVFNAALLKIAPVRVYCKPKRVEPETYEYKFEGTEEEFIDDFSSFEEANPNIVSQQPVFDSGAQVIEPEAVEGAQPPVPGQPPAQPPATKIKVEMKWNLELPDDKEMALDIISPGSFFVSRQADSLEDARMVAQIALLRISDLRDMYPDAHKMNGKKDKEETQFWEELQSEYIEWFRENEWLERWSYDSLGLNETEDSQASDDAAGLGSREVFVMDAEIWMDLDDSGMAKLYHVVKAGGYVLEMKEIAERSFLCSSLVPTGNKWIGLSFFDLLSHDLREESTLTRAFTNAALDAATPHAEIDFRVIEQKDAQDIHPGSIFRTKANAPNTGRPGVQWHQPPGPSPATLEAINLFKQNASVFTGVGQGFQGGSVQDTASMRVGENAAKIIENNSSLMQNYFAQKLDDMLAKLMVKIWNVAVMAGVNPEMYHTKGEWSELDPSQQETRYEFIINADVGLDAKAEKLSSAAAMMETIATPVPGIQWLPQAGYEIGKRWLEANEIFDVDNYLVNPSIQEQIGVDPQMQAFLAATEQQMQMQVAQQIEAAQQQILEMPDSQLKAAQARLADAKAGTVVPELDHKREKDAAIQALNENREDRIDERSAVDKALDLKRVELQEEEILFEMDLATKELAQGKPTSNIGAG